MDYLGESAALATAILWAFTSIFFAGAGRLVGSFVTNTARLFMAVIIYTVVLAVISGHLIAEDTTWSQIGWLGLSGIVGLAVGDGLGFKALVMIGPRLTTLLYSAAPIIVTIVAWAFLGESLSWLSALGIIVTIAGIVWVVLERRPESAIGRSGQPDHPDSGSLLKGVLLGLGAAAGQAVGLVLAKQGMSYTGAGMTPLEACFIRMVVGFAVMLATAGFRGKIIEVARIFIKPKALGYCSAGAVSGPFLAVWMSLVAIKLIPTGVAATLNAMTPVAVIPLVAVMGRERVSARAILGALVAVGGSAILFLS